MILHVRANELKFAVCPDKHQEVPGRGREAKDCHLAAYARPQQALGN